MGTWAENGGTDLLLSGAKLIAAITTKKWMQPKLRSQHVISTCGAAVGYRKRYRCNFEAMSKVSVTDCDGHIYIHILYIYSYKHSAT